MAEIIATTKDLYIDNQLREVCVMPISALDPHFSGLSPETKYEILKAKYYNQLISDGLEIGYIKLDNLGIPQYNIPYQKLESVIGFIFEAFIVRVINQNMRTIGRKLFEICSNRSNTTDNYIDQYKAIGTGFVTTEQLYPNFYNRTENIDIKFIRANKEGIYEPATILGTTTQRGYRLKLLHLERKTRLWTRYCQDVILVF